MNEHLTTLRSLLEVAYEEQSLIETLLPHQRDADWVEMYHKHKQYISDLEDSYRHVGKQIHPKQRFTVLQGGKV